MEIGGIAVKCSICKEKEAVCDVRVWGGTLPTCAECACEIDKGGFTVLREMIYQEQGAYHAG